jgi:hypothetical protein
MSEHTSKESQELAAVLQRLQAEHAKYAAITAELANTIQNLQKVFGYLEHGVPIQMPLQAASPIQAIEQTPTIIPQPQIGAPLSPLTEPTNWTRRLRGMSHAKALIRIARENNGIVKTTEARDILLQAGVASGKPRNVNSHIHTLLSRSDQFERIEPGVYRLIQPSVPKPVRDAPQQEQGAITHPGWIA